MPFSLFLCKAGRLSVNSPAAIDRLIEPLEAVDQEDRELSPAERRMLDVLGYVED